METEFAVTIRANEDYHYSVEISKETLAIVYYEEGIKPIKLEFGNLMEMEAVAQAMLKASSLAKASESRYQYSLRGQLI